MDQLKKQKKRFLSYLDAGRLSSTLRAARTASVAAPSAMSDVYVFFKILLWTAVCCLMETVALFTSSVPFFKKNKKNKDDHSASISPSTALSQDNLTIWITMCPLIRWRCVYTFHFLVYYKCYVLSIHTHTQTLLHCGKSIKSLYTDYSCKKKTTRL